MATEEKILDRVRALLAIAEHPNTPAEEADTALTQANRLMTKHAIEEATLRATQSRAERRAVERKRVTLNDNGSFEFAVNMRNIMAQIANANRLQAVMIGFQEIELFGMHDDIVWVEQLYTQIYFDFVSRLSPKWDKAASYEANVYRFKNAGFKWSDINITAVQAGQPDMEDKKIEKRYNYVTRDVQDMSVGTGMYRKMHAAYKRQVKLLAAQGEDVVVVAASNPTQYRRDFAEGFSVRIQNRLWTMAQDSKDEASKVPGSALALSSMTEEIREAYEEAYPQFSRAARDLLKAEQDALAQKLRDERDAMLDSMSPKARYDFLEKERRAEERENKRNRAYWDKQDQKTSWAGRNAGRDAANTVSLARNAGRAEAGARQGELG